MRGRQRSRVTDALLNLVREEHACLGVMPEVGQAPHRSRRKMAPGLHSFGGRRPRLLLRNRMNTVAALSSSSGTGPSPDALRNYLSERSRTELDALRFELDARLLALEARSRARTTANRWSPWSSTSRASPWTKPRRPHGGQFSTRSPTRRRRWSRRAQKRDRPSRRRARRGRGAPSGSRRRPRERRHAPAGTRGIAQRAQSRTRNEQRAAEGSPEDARVARIRAHGHQVPAPRSGAGAGRARQGRGRRTRRGDPGRGNRQHRDPASHRRRGPPACGRGKGRQPPLRHRQGRRRPPSDRGRGSRRDRAAPGPE